jgi:histone H3/H4
MSSFDEESMADRTADAEAVVIMEGEAENDDSHVVAVAVLDDDDDDDEDDDESMAHDHDDETTEKSVLTYDDKSVLTTESQEMTPRKEKSSSRKSTHKHASHRRSPCAKKGRSPAVRGLTIPFRAVKRIMKLDPDIATVQNEAAVLVTLASELFVKSLAKESYLNAKSRGRGTIR